MGRGSYPRDPPRPLGRSGREALAAAAAEVARLTGAVAASLAGEQRLETAELAIRTGLTRGTAACWKTLDRLQDHDARHRHTDLPLPGHQRAGFPRSRHVGNGARRLVASLRLPGWWLMSGGEPYP